MGSGDQGEDSQREGEYHTLRAQAAQNKEANPL